MRTGSIKFYNAVKGFGFITDREGRDLFFHVTKMRGYAPGIQASFNDGEVIEFEEIEGSKGPEAIDVKKLSGEKYRLLVDMEMIDDEFKKQWVGIN